jgi:gamma-carbonic anhydrase
LLLLNDLKVIELRYKIKMPIYPFIGMQPQFDASVFIAPSAELIGNVTLGSESSLWFNVTVRGDVNYIRIGYGTNIQDGSVIHVTTNTHPTLIGDYVTIGHNVTLHGCTINNLSLIGIGAIILDGAIVEEKALVAAGCLVPPGKIVPSGTLFAGSPGEVKRRLTPQELDFFKISAENYIKLKNIYIAQTRDA